MLKYCTVIFSLFLFGCTNKPKERRIELDDVVDYREILFQGNDSLPTFKLSKERTILDSLKANNYWFDESYGRVFKWFNLELNKKKIRVGAYKHYPPPGTYPRDVIEVVVNRKNILLFERELVELEEFNILLYKHLSRGDFKYNEYLTFQWDEVSSLQTIDSVFHQIEQGYTLFYDSIAYQDYDVPIHNLSVQQLKSIQKDYPFDVIILVKNRPTQFGSDERFFQGFYYK